MKCTRLEDQLQGNQEDNEKRHVQYLPARNFMMVHVWTTTFLPRFEWCVDCEERKTNVHV